MERFCPFYQEIEEDIILFVKILDNLDIIHFEPFFEKRPRGGIPLEGNKKKGPVPMIEKEIFEIPRSHYFKLGYKKENSDAEKKISYRRIFSDTLEEKNNFKLPFTEKEIDTINSKLSDRIFLRQKILKSQDKEFIFNSPFKTEHLIRGKTQQEKNNNSLFENMKDASKYAYVIKNNEMIPDDTDKKNKTSLHGESDGAQIQKLSKGTFKYLIRTYNNDMFNNHIKRLEKAISLFHKDQIGLHKRKSNTHGMSKNFYT